MEEHKNQSVRTLGEILPQDSRAVSTKADGREPKSCLNRVFKFKLGHFAS